MDASLTGVVPVVPTIFRDDESVDLKGTARVVDYLIDGEVDGLCLLANYSEQFSLTDAERDTIARTLLEEHVSALAAGGAAVLVVEQRARAVLAISDRTYVLAGGEVRMEGTPAELAASPAFVESFLGGTVTR